MSPNEIFIKIYNEVRKSGVKYEPNFKTIGGFWTVDKWTCQYGDLEVSVRLEDEGWTSRIVTPSLNVVSSGSSPDLRFEKGSAEELEALHNIIF